MIEAFQYINKAFESKVRLGIMAILMVNEEADFNFLKEQLSLTDGNLASHTPCPGRTGIYRMQQKFCRTKATDCFSGNPARQRSFQIAY